MNEQEMQMKLASQQKKIEAFRQEIAEINKEREFWQQVHIQAAIAAMQCMNSGDWEDNDGLCTPEMIAKWSVRLADALVEELKKGGQEC